MRSNRTARDGGGEVLLAGTPPGLERALGELLPGTVLRSAGDAASALEELGRGGVAAVVVEHELDGGGGAELVRLLRERPGGRSIPVLYCARSSLPVEAARELVRSLGVWRLLFHPLDAGEVAEGLAAALRAGAPPGAREEEALAAAVSSARERFRGLTLRRLEALEAATAALARGALDPETRRRAEQEAHKLAGSAGIFGSGEGSRLARSVERLLEGDRPLTGEDSLALDAWMAALRRELGPPPGAGDGG